MPKLVAVAPIYATGDLARILEIEQCQIEDTILHGCGHKSPLGIAARRFANAKHREHTSASPNSREC